MKGDLVKEIRRYKDMTQPEFAEWLGVAESTIAQVESGHRNVSEALRSKIAHRFDTTDKNFIAYQKRRGELSKYFNNV